MFHVFYLAEEIVRSAKFADLFKRAASRVLIVHCMTPLELIAALRNVHSIVNSSSGLLAKSMSSSSSTTSTSGSSSTVSATSGDRAPSSPYPLLLIDNVTAFFWTHKAQDKAYSFYALLAKQITELLKSVARLVVLCFSLFIRFLFRATRLALIVTKQMLGKQVENKNGNITLGQSWDKMLTYRMILRAHPQWHAPCFRGSFVALRPSSSSIANAQFDYHIATEAILPVEQE